MQVESRSQEEDPRPPLFTQDGRHNPAFKEWQRRNIHFASPEVCEVSGVGDTVVTALGKLAVKIHDDEFRRITNRLIRVTLMPDKGRIYTEKNGAGLTYYRLKMELSRSDDNRRNQRSIYLGTDPRVKKWAEELLEELRRCNPPPKPKPDFKRADSIKRILRMVKRKADNVARKAGYWFNGYYLVEDLYE